MVVAALLQLQKNMLQWQRQLPGDALQGALLDEVRARVGKWGFCQLCPWSLVPCTLTVTTGARGQLFGKHLGPWMESSSDKSQALALLQRFLDALPSPWMGNALVRATLADHLARQANHCKVLAGGQAALVSE